MSIISGGSSGSGSGSVVAVSSTTAPATAASLTISGIPGSFNHLQLIVSNARCDLTTGAGVMNMKFNNDSTAIYDFNNGVVLSGGSSITGTGVAAATAARIAAITPATAVAGAFALVNVLIPSYASALYKQWVGGGFRKDSDVLGGLIEEIPSGSYRSATAITTVTILPVGTSGTAQNFQTGTAMFLYGIT